MINVKTIFSWINRINHGKQLYRWKLCACRSFSSSRHSSHSRTSRGRVGFFWWPKNRNRMSRPVQCSEHCSARKDVLCMVLPKIIPKDGIIKPNPWCLNNIFDCYPLFKGSLFIPKNLPIHAITKLLWTFCLSFIFLFFSSYDVWMSRVLKVQKINFQ